jgi:hyperosmotically inducible periplasmic protein
VIIMIKKLFFQISMFFAAMLVAKTPPTAAETMAKEIRHELVMLPYYSVAESAVKRVEGVISVDNQIEVLPLSPNDDRIRLAVYQAIYSRGSLQRLRLNAVLPIHIIVRNGNITLEGIVATEGDKHLAGVAANGVSGAFTLKNNLDVEK